LEVGESRITWRIIHNSMLWGRVKKSNYLGCKSIMEWFRSLEKLGSNNSVGWKTMVKVFPIIGNWTVWQVGNGKSIKTSEYPWVNAGLDFKLSCVSTLHD
jgi:hypothetical protein